MIAKKSGARVEVTVKARSGETSSRGLIPTWGIGTKVQAIRKKYVWAKIMTLKSVVLFSKFLVIK
jgi:hypothetical protein